jgi:hypothetical protein
MARLEELMWGASVKEILPSGSVIVADLNRGSAPSDDDAWGMLQDTAILLD